MGLRLARIRSAIVVAPLVVAFAALGGCSTAGIGGDAVATTGSVAAPSPEPVVSKPLDEVKDDLALGKEHFRAGNFGLAELHFRKSVESSAGSPEAWLGLAAAYDEMKRFKLADRAYGEALKLTGPSAELLNNRGYSYLLRGDLRRASKDLSAAAALDPENERIQNNLKILDRNARKRV
jgi:Flp pilus assembly protein TadD